MTRLLKHIRLITTILLLGFSGFLLANSEDTLGLKVADFIENKGQWNPKVRYKQVLTNGYLYFEKDRLTFDLIHPDDKVVHTGYKYGKATEERNIRHHAYQMHFEGALSDVKIQGYGKSRAHYNYFIGNDTSKWVSRAHSYHTIQYSNLYQGIDLKIYNLNGLLKYDFIVNPSADPKDIKINYRYIDKLRIKNGNLIVTTSVNKITELRPFAYQLDENGERQRVVCEFELTNNVLSYKVGTYDKSKKLVIDPILVFASYSGSTADNWGFTATYDSHGFLYGGGISFGSGYPTTFGAYDQTFNGPLNSVDISISKFDTTGSTLLYSTYLGGTSNEAPSSIVVNSNDELYILGVTSSSNYPTTNNAYDQSFAGGVTADYSGVMYSNGTDIIISRLSSNGTQLLSSTYFGGVNNDGLNEHAELMKNYGDAVRGEIVFDDNDNCYIASSTFSSGLATANAFQTAPMGDQEGIIAKFDYQLSNLSWSSYFGGTDGDGIYSLAVDQNQDIYITGGTSSTNLPTNSNVLFPSFQGGVSDGYIAHIHKNGNLLYNATYIGSSYYDQSYFVDVDKYNNVYVFGQTLDTGSVFVFNATWNKPGASQFISKMSSDLSSFVWSTQFGRTNSTGIDIVPSAFMVDLCNRVYLSAWGGKLGTQNVQSSSTQGLPITSNAFQSTTDGKDYYFMVMMDDASGLSYGSYYGGSNSGEHVDGGTSRFDNHGRIYQAVCAGCGGNSDFPTTLGSYSQNNQSHNCNMGVIKINFELPVVVADFAKPGVNCAPVTINFNNTSSYVNGSTSSSCQWDFGDGTTSNQCNPIHTYTASGIYDVQLVVSDPSSCNLADTFLRQVVVLSNTLDTLPTKKVCLGDVVQIGIPPVNDTSVTYQWLPATNLSSTTISNPICNTSSTTQYTLLLSNGTCTDTLIQKVRILDIEINLPADTTICQNQITLTAKTNEQCNRFVWSTNSQFTDTLNSSIYDSTLVISSINGPRYFYIKASFFPCYGIDSILVDKRVYASHTSNEPLCNGDSNGSISIQPLSGNAPFDFQWNGSTSSTSTAANLAAGTYYVTVSDQDGCFTVDTITLQQPDSLKNTRFGRNIPCQNACIGEAHADAFGGTLPYQYQWNDGASQTTNPATNLCEGTYIVTITDANQCTRTDTIIIVDSSQYMTFDAWVGTGMSHIYEGEDVYFFSTDFGSGYTYSWEPSASLQSPNSPNTLGNPLTSTLFIVNVEDTYGCRWSDSVMIHVTDVICEEPYIFVPNSFTPNNDGKNDVLYVRSNYIYNMTFRIYNRWGEKVFETTDSEIGWDGTFKGSALEPDVYDYELVVTCYNKEIYNKTGNITLIR